MELVRFATDDGPRIGIIDGPAGYSLDPKLSLASLLSEPLDVIRYQVGQAAQPRPSSELALLAPVDGRTEVWAAGVTYERSKQARISESQHEADVYDRVGFLVPGKADG